MKKIFTIIIISFFLSSLCSCNNTNMVNLDNIIWENEDFSINVSSDILKKQNDKSVNPSSNDYYATITIFDIEYSCLIFSKFDFLDDYYYMSIVLMDINDNSIIYFDGGDNPNFLFGKYYIYERENNKYIYELSLLIKDCEYYEYCKTNNKFCPYHITFYGYENEE